MVNKQWLVENANNNQGGFKEMGRIYRKEGRGGQVSHIYISLLISQNIHSKYSFSREIKLIGVYPPIEKMEGPFHLLINCEKFSLSTNMISNIANLQVKG